MRPDTAPWYGLQFCLLDLWGGGGIVGIVVGQPNQGANPAHETVRAWQRTTQVTQLRPRAIGVSARTIGPGWPAYPTVRPAGAVRDGNRGVAGPNTMEVVPRQGRGRSGRGNGTRTQ